MLRRLSAVLCVSFGFQFFLGIASQWMESPLAGFLDTTTKALMPPGKRKNHVLTLSLLIRQLTVEERDSRHSTLSVCLSVCLSTACLSLTGVAMVVVLVLRTLFDYDPMCDAGLPGRGLDFKFGHILNVVGDEDADWWHAVRVVPDDGGSGVVPSKRR